MLIHIILLAIVVFAAALVQSTSGFGLWHCFYGGYSTFLAIQGMHCLITDNRRIFTINHHYPSS